MPERKRLDYIDSLRGFAALFVLVFHIIRIPSPALLYSKALHPILEMGGSGVTLFFVISAFTLCFTLDGRTNEKNWISSFYLRRIQRIIPLYYFWIILMVFVFYTRYYVRDIPKYLFFLYNFIPGKQEGIVGASWTLGVEMVFYAIFPFIFKRIYNVKRAVLFALFAVSLSYIHYFTTKDIKGYYYYLSLFEQLPVFAVGIITYYVHRDYLGRIKKKGNASVILLALFAVIFFLSWLISGHSSSVTLYLLAIGYGCLILGLSLKHYKFIVNRVTVFLGIISFSIYLNHPMLVYFLTPYFRQIYSFDIASYLKLPVCVLLGSVPLIAISYLTYIIIEKPGGRFIKWIGGGIISISP